jgi:hypothetical protein
MVEGDFVDFEICIDLTIICKGNLRYTHGDLPSRFQSCVRTSCQRFPLITTLLHVVFTDR